MTDPASRQFTLRSLLILTTAAAVLAAIGSLAGRGWVLVLIGVFVALANYLGILALVQRPWFARVVLYLTMIPFTASFFLPVLYIPFGPQEGLPGYVFCIGFATSYRTLFEAPLTWLALARTTALFATQVGNLALAALPLLVHRVVVDKARWYMLVLTFAAGISWSAFAVGKAPEPGIGYGYFVWCGALTAPLVVVRLPRGRFIALLVMLAAAAMLIWYENLHRTVPGA